MRPYLLVDGLTKSYGDRVLFDTISFGVNEGDKIGIVAKNGTGKSTLLRLLADREAPDSGTVTFRGGLRVGFLDQAPVFAESLSVVDNLLPAIAPN
ncbi:MAG: ATP-binding cassette domain-containing protein, partial [Duncaniella sp.]|nr:ATP-binding cassette domain-containing protein [Duncaniella sp.]